MARKSVILLGSKPGSVLVLKLLLQNNWQVKCVVVPRNFDSSWIQGPTLEEVARQNNITVFKSQKEIPDGFKVDYVLSYMYRSLVNERTRNFATGSALNFHAGPLPKFGGWAFYNVAIIENVKTYGCTCHYMDNGFDTGPLLKVREFEINPRIETAVSLERRTQQEMILLFKDFMEMATSGVTLPKISQIKSEMRYLNADEFKELKKIPLSANEETIDRYARAFWYPPYECAYFEINGVKVEIVPQVVKNEIAKLLHSKDFDLLNNV